MNKRTLRVFDCIILRQILTSTNPVIQVTVVTKISTFHKKEKNMIYDFYEIKFLT